MNPVKAFRLVRLWEQAQGINKEKVFVSKKVLQYLHLAVTASAVLGVPTMADKWLHQPEHATVFGVLVAVSVLLHAIQPSIFGGPSEDAQSKANTIAQKLPLLLVALLLVPALHAQTTVPEGTLPANIYAIGPSYNPSASPSIAGSAFYGRLVAGTGTYAFTVMDALPEPVKPFTVSTNVGMGIAQKLVTFRNVPIYGAMGTGIHWTGADTNWQWNGGVLAAIPLKKACATCYLMPNDRFLSVGGGQYRLIVGLWFGFGQ